MARTMSAIHTLQMAETGISKTDFGTFSSLSQKENGGNSNEKPTSACFCLGFASMHGYISS
ncbi:MAG: hypothetical protein ACI4WX_11965 [Aristaeellaceae bacterium]